MQILRFPKYLLTLTVSTGQEKEKDQDRKKNC